MCFSRLSTKRASTLKKRSRALVVLLRNSREQGGCVDSIRIHCSSFGRTPVTRRATEESRTSISRVRMGSAFHYGEDLLLDHSLGLLRNIQEHFERMAISGRRPAYAETQIAGRIEKSCGAVICIRPDKKPDTPGT